MPNSYTVSLYDLATWQEVRTSPSPSPSPRPSPSPIPNPHPHPNPNPTPNPNQVDVVVDERLARKPDGTGLLGCEPSRDGELWACYLEKAVAAHCGGWDKIDGGQCTHAWALLTGCKAQLYPDPNPNPTPNPNPNPDPSPNPNQVQGAVHHH